jgi:chromosome segregation ATPase
MTNHKKKNKKLVSFQDDDPTAELEILTEPDQRDAAASADVQLESEAHTSDFSKADVDDGDAAISNLAPQAESIGKLQFDLESLRSRWAGLEKEIEVREEVAKNLTKELKLVHQKESQTSELLKTREHEIEILKSKLASMEVSLKESAQQIKEAGGKTQKSESRASVLQAELDTAEEKLDDLRMKLQAEYSEKQEIQDQAQSLSVEIGDLNNELTASRASVSELQYYIDRRKSDWDKKEAKLARNQQKIGQLSSQLETADTGLQDSRAIQDDLNATLVSLRSERDELQAEIKKLRQDSQAANSWRKTEDKKWLEEQKGLLVGKDFEISELRNQKERTESYADGLRKQLQEQLALKEELQVRQKHLEVLLANAKSQVAELSEGIEELRSSNSDLVTEKSKLEQDLANELQQIRLELGEAQANIEDRDSINQQLTADLVDTREVSMNLETRLSSIEEDNKTAIAKLRRKLKKAERLNEELEHKLSNKDNVISSLMNELTNRSEAVESINEIEDIIHDLDNRMSERIDDKSESERERITRLLVGYVDGQKLRFPLFKDRLTIGRTIENDIQLKAPYISRRHAVIVTDEDGTRIVDWGSKNGVFVNTDRIREQILHNGDVVTIGTADFKFEERPKQH